MTRRPSFQFYPSDWQANTNLRRCTFEERGIWLEVMCLMHDANEYGLLRWPLKDIAQAIGCKCSLLGALVGKHVMKGADSGDTCEAFVYTPRSGRVDGPPVTLIPEQPGPLWYSSRMVKDEYVRQNSGLTTRFKKREDSAHPSPQPSPSQWQGEDQGEYGSDGSSSSSSSSSSVLKEKNASMGRTLCSGTAEEEDIPFVGDYLEATGSNAGLLELPCKGGESYPITQKTLDEWRKAFPKLDGLSEARRMKFWLEGHKDRQKTQKGMGRFFSIWLGNAMDRLRSAAPLQVNQGIKNAQVADYLEANPDLFREVDSAS